MSPLWVQDWVLLPSLALPPHSQSLEVLAGQGKGDQWVSLRSGCGFLAGLSLTGSRNIGSSVSAVLEM